jgi:hypothetical protein
MFWKNRGGPSKPKDIPDIVGGHLVTDYNQNPDMVWKLKAVKRRRQESKNAFDVRVFDDLEATTKKVKVKDYTTLDGHPELILYEGWYDLESRTVQLEVKRTA